MNVLGKCSNSVSFDTLSDLIVTAIEEEKFFDKKKLIPKVRAIIKAFGVNLSRIDYQREEKVSERGKRLRQIEEKDLVIKFWKGKTMQLAGGDIDNYFTEIDTILEDNGFRTKK